MRIGIHTSTAGSLEKSALKAHELGANTFQIFSASPRMWRAKNPDPTQVKLLQRAREQYDLQPLVIHDSYLINLASEDQVIRSKSIEAFTGEIERAIVIGADYLVAHPGNYKDLTREQGILNVAEGLAKGWMGVKEELQKNARLTILLENTAGAKNQIGGDLADLATLRQLVTPYLDIPIGYCLDTCHLYVYGRDISTETGLAAAIREAEEILGLEHVPVMHANDAKTRLGSHLDRHAHIGDGYIGTEGFRRILNHPQLQKKAFILETPVDKPGDDLRNVTALKELVPFPNKRLTTNKSKQSGTRGGKTMPPST
ncbi:MAG TPA: deoxyribonuclease IV [Bryobacteraceae bacterium]|nr:deoxyribonuclease IV [Bryobacteraceae bacterium]